MTAVALPSAELASESPAPLSPGDVFRPVQYLGSKLRSLKPITEVVRDLLPAGRVADPFTGTTVVSQAIAATGNVVNASDALASCEVFARALLGVGRGPDPVDIDRVLSEIPEVDEFRWYAPWEAWVAREAEAVSRGDGLSLIQISLDLPQVWRATHTSPTLAAQLEEVASFSGRLPAGRFPLAATHYAGTFFGIRQALELDGLRQATRNLRESGHIGPWLEAVLITAILSAASDCSFSAGKHYAQAHAIHREKNLTFAARRIVDDRSKDLRNLFQARVRKVLQAARPASEGHRADRTTLEALASAARPWSDVGVVYADPPYTAQQYSRFYHVPEVLAAYRVPKLEIVNGRPTQGLYPEGRYKSAFSSKSRAPAAFDALCGSTARADASLVLSYSASMSGQSGNDRMISLEHLVGICSQHYRTHAVEVIELGHAYRQFNGDSAALDTRQDREFLIVCRADP